MIASFTMDEAYFRECLGEWVGSVSKVRKFEPLLCALFAFAGSSNCDPNRALRPCRRLALPPPL